MAEFQEVVRQAKRMCGAQNDCEECPIFEECEGSGYISWERTADAEAVERKIMGWAAENPEPRYPTWTEWLREFSRAGIDLYKPIPADIAEKLGIKPIGGVSDDEA